MIVGIHHGGVAVRNLSRAIVHLRMLTDWKVEHRLDSTHPLIAGTGAAGAALLQGPNAFLELVEVAGMPTSRRTVAEPGVTHLSIQLPDMAAKNRELAENGVERHAEPVELGTGFSYLYVRDREHNVVEIEGAGHAPVGLATWFSHVGIATNDVGRLRTVYEHFLGNPAKASARIAGVAALDAVTAIEDADVTMTWVPAANANVELIQFHHPPPAEPEPREFATPGVGHICFEVDDVAIESARAVTAGMQEVGMATSPDGTAVARLLDPDGNWVELISFASPADSRSLLNVESFNRYREMDALLAERSAQ